MYTPDPEILADVALEAIADLRFVGGPKVVIDEGDLLQIAAALAAFNKSPWYRQALPSQLLKLDRLQDLLAVCLLSVLQIHPLGPENDALFSELLLTEVARGNGFKFQGDISADWEGLLGVAAGPDPSDDSIGLVKTWLTGALEVVSGHRNFQEMRTHRVRAPSSRFR